MRHRHRLNKGVQEPTGGTGSFSSFSLGPDPGLGLSFDPDLGSDPSGQFPKVDPKVNPKARFLPAEVPPPVPYIQVRTFGEVPPPTPPLRHCLFIS